MVFKEEPQKGGGIAREMRKFMKDIRANLEQMDNKKTSRFNQITIRWPVCFNMFDEVRTDMARMRTDLTETRTKVIAVSSKVDEIESSVQIHASKVADLSKAHDEK